jgi:hypothetical protein
LSQNAHTETTHTLSGTDTQAQYYIKQGHTELHHKHTSYKGGLRPHRGKYGVQNNLVHKAITDHDVTRRYTTMTNRTSKISYRPMSTFTFSQKNIRTNDSV